MHTDSMVRTSLSVFPECSTARLCDFSSPGMILETHMSMNLSRYCTTFVSSASTGSQSLFSLQTDFFSPELSCFLFSHLIRNLVSSQLLHSSLTGESILRVLTRFMEQVCHGTLLRFLAQPHLELLDFIWFVVVNGDGTDGIAVCWNRAVSCVCLQRADDHDLARISVSGCNDEGVVLLVRVSWCKRWSLHACPPSFAGKLKTVRR